MEPCKQEGKIEIMHELLTEVRNDIKTLLAWKWKLTGIIVACSAISAIIFNVVIN